MSEPYDPFDPKNLGMSPEQKAAYFEAKRKDAVSKSMAKPKKPLWCKFDYVQMLKLAESSRNPLILVLAELSRLKFESWEKDSTVLVTLNNTTFKKLGFHRTDKIRALKELEKAGLVSVDWRNRKSPQVRLLFK
jgi:hypothetical protein